MGSELEQLIQMAIAEAKLGNKKRARSILADVARRQPQNARVWYLLSQVVEQPAQAIDCLRRVLALDPDNLQARNRLEKLQSQTEALKPKRFSGGILGWVALAVVACVGLPVCLLGGVAGYSYIAGPAALNAQMDVRATVDGALVATLASFPSATPMPTRTATELPPATLTEIPTHIPSLTPVDTAAVPAEVQAGPSGCVPRENRLEAGTVTRVIDGDTIEVFVNGQTLTIRYIGIDAPETVNPNTGVQYFGPQASEKNRQLVEGKNVILVKDVSETDHFGRLLRYVLVGDLYGQFVNYELVRQGYASASTYPPDVACEKAFRAAQREAAADGVGLWGPTPVPTVTPVVVVVQPPAGSGGGIHTVGVEL